MGKISKTIHISDTVHGSIPISYLEKKVISTRIFNRLHNISQNSTAYLTYPTNRTKRFEHSIGTMHICSQMFMYGVNNAEAKILESFFHDFKKEIESILEDKLSGDGNHIYRTKLNDKNFRKTILYRYSEDIKINDYLYNISIPKNVFDLKLEIPYIILFQAIRLAAMLHDVGHPPMSHITENAIENIQKKINSKKIKNDKENEFLGCISAYVEDNKKIQLHEKIGSELSRKLFEDNIEPYHKNDCSEKLYQVLFELLVMDTAICILGEKTSFFKWVHRIIDGSLDGDRLDYVTRDPMNSGIDTGKIEYDRLLSTIKLVEYEDGSYWFCPNLKMIDIVDDFFYRRWKMYEKIILHHRVVKTDYLMENCIQEITENFFEKNNTHSTISEDEEILPYDISGLWKGIKQEASYQVFFDKVLQWDDGWLLTILKKHFYRDFKDRDSTKIYYKLEELISNKKSYYSLIKKDADSLLLDRRVAEVVSIRKHEIVGLINKLKNIKSIEKSEDKGEYEKSPINIDPFLDKVVSFFEYENRIVSSDLNFGDYILSFFKFELSILFPYELMYNRIIEKALKVTMENYEEIDDWFYSVKSIKTGIGQNLMLYSEEEKGEPKIHIYEHISNSKYILEKYRNSLIPVYVYFRKIDDAKMVDFTDMIKRFGENIGSIICDEIEFYINILIENKEEDNKCAQ